MKISIITVVYNNEKTIRDALESVLTQSFSDLEYIVIDGSSQDSTVSIIREYEDKLSYFISERDSGIYDAMNKGIRAAKGDVIGILNSDDLYYSRTVLEDVMIKFEEDHTLDIVYGNLVYVDQEDVGRVVRTWKSKQYYLNFFEHGNVPPHPSLFLRRKVYENVGLFDLNFRLAADYELMLRVFKSNCYKSLHIDKVFVKMRLGGATNRDFRNVKLQNREVLQSWRTNKMKAPFFLMPCRIVKRLVQFIQK